jgi:hypothetical protein
MGDRLEKRDKMRWVRAFMCTAVRNRMKPKEIREFAVADLRSAD